MKSPRRPGAPAGAPLDTEAAGQLLRLARDAIEREMAGAGAESNAFCGLAPELLERRAAFVTLRLHGELRGCIGALEARDPLARCVCENARRAAFHDPRFAPLRSDELDDVEIEISILSPLEPIAVDSRRELIASLRPGVDGLLIESGPHRATFLPSVWESLPNPDDFLRELERKADLPGGDESVRLDAWRYTAQHIP